MLDKMKSTFPYLVPNFCHKVDFESAAYLRKYKGSSATSPVTEAAMEPSTIQPTGESFDAAALSGLAPFLPPKLIERSAPRAGIEVSGTSQFPFENKDLSSPNTNVNNQSNISRTFARYVTYVTFGIPRPPIRIERWIHSFERLTALRRILHAALLT